MTDLRTTFYARAYHTCVKARQYLAAAANARALQRCDDRLSSTEIKLWRYAEQSCLTLGQR